MGHIYKTAALRRPIYVVQVDLDSDGYVNATADIQAYWLDLAARRLAWREYDEDEEDAKACVNYLQAKWSDACVMAFPSWVGHEMPRLTVVKLNPLPF